MKVFHFLFAVHALGFLIEGQAKRTPQRGQEHLKRSGLRKSLSSAEAQRVFSGEEDLLSNVSTGTELPSTAESARAYSPPDRSI